MLTSNVLGGTRQSVAKFTFVSFIAGTGVGFAVAVTVVLSVASKWASEDTTVVTFIASLARTMTSETFTMAGACIGATLDMAIVTLPVILAAARAVKACAVFASDTHLQVTGVSHPILVAIANTCQDIASTMPAAVPWALNLSTVVAAETWLTVTFAENAVAPIAAIVGTLNLGTVFFVPTGIAKAITISSARTVSRTLIGTMF
jgi:hypothetical protein